MDPKVVEQFICLSLNPDSGRYTVLGNYLTYGITGAMLMDLALNEKIKIKDRYILEGDDRSRPGISSYDRMLEKIIDSNRSRTIKKWVQKSGRRSSWYRKEVQKYLVEKGILRQESKRFIGIPYKLHYPAKPGYRKTLIKRYKEIILYGKEPEEHEIMVLGLIYACKMHKVLSGIGPERRKIRKKLVELIKDNAFAKDISKTIIEMQAAITASIAATAAVSAATSSASG